MCGIGGFFAQRPVPAAVADAMQRALRPRGPDAEHTAGFLNNRLFHARLSIIDPRPEADQPMANERGDIWIVYNGEVYDWASDAAALRAAGAVFRTRSDTEFILRAYEAWGIERLLERLRGMFAFAILDARAGKAFIARDRMGEKPLIYSCVDGELVFGSLVRAVLPFLPAAQRVLSPEGIDAYLALVVTSEDEPDIIGTRLVGLLTSQAIAQLGEAPRWLAEGIGRMAAARSGGKQGPAAAWDAAIPAALASVKKPQDLLDGKLPPEQADLLAYGLARFLYDRSNRRLTDKLLRALTEGVSLPDAVKLSYGVDPPELVRRYGAWQQSQFIRRR